MSGASIKINFLSLTPLMVNTKIICPERSPRAMKVHTYTTYDFAELSASAQETAIEQVASKLAGEWWDSGDTEAVQETIVYKLAEALLTPGWNTFGSGDFPGIPNVKIISWDVEQGASLELDGTFTIKNAPALPWPAYCDRFRVGRDSMKWVGNKRSLWITDSYPEWPADEDRADVQAFLVAWDAAVAQALDAGRAELEYKSSTEYAREWLDANYVESLQFTVDGVMLP